ncbi:Cytochrome oxidase assembly protein ShyY1 [Microbacterium sp. LKL04]|uniref:SURF1 family protein n=1 Tax=Microbacterium sp. LKL04 TaxID=912630 RepID=UPI000875E379|nr:SURF1 family cytochrome oxidase biogenesis protein [Microbacterium sp. LKL04]SCY45915.1 Cytochrome oxidase assembly protein ShyY1 [Microbacterium sp. LKL04]
MTATPSVDDLPEVFPPTLREVMVRPFWIGMLGLALLVAGIFAWLGQWQLGNAIDTDPPPAGMTEQVRPLGDVVRPGASLPEPLVGQRVQVSGSFVAGDFRVVTSRFDDGEPGYWVAGQLRVDPSTTGTDGPTSLAVAVGFTPDRAAADEAVSTLNAAPPQNVDLSGRLISDEGAKEPPRGGDPFEISAMSPAALLSQWSDTVELDVYRPYLVSADAFGGLRGIHSPAPTELSSVNWLNIFYAVEWAVFAGFAFYMWYRLARDAWEKEVEALIGEDDPEGDEEPSARP